MVELSRGTDVFHAQQVENSRWIRTALRAAEQVKGQNEGSCWKSNSRFQARK